MVKPRIRLFNDPDIAVVKHRGHNVKVCFIRDYDGGEYSLPYGCYYGSFESLEAAVKKKLEYIDYRYAKADKPGYSMSL